MSVLVCLFGVLLWMFGEGDGQMIGCLLMIGGGIGALMDR